MAKLEALFGPENHEEALLCPFEEIPIIALTKKEVARFLLQGNPDLWENEILVIHKHGGFTSPHSEIVERALAESPTLRRRYEQLACDQQDEEFTELFKRATADT